MYSGTELNKFEIFGRVIIVKVIFVLVSGFTAICVSVYRPFLPNIGFLFECTTFSASVSIVLSTLEIVIYRRFLF